MDSTHFKRSPDHEYPAISLDMTNFMEHLSDEYLCGKTEVRDEGVQTNPNTIDCKTEDSTNLEELPSFSGINLQREEKVRTFDVEFVVLHHKRIW